MSDEGLPRHDDAEPEPDEPAGDDGAEDEAVGIVPPDFDRDEHDE